MSKPVTDNMTADEFIRELRGILDSLDPDNDPRIIKGQIGEPVTEPTHVYRVEMPNGRGPFNSGLPGSGKIYRDLVKPEPGWPGWLLLHDDTMHHEQMGVTELAFKEAHGHAAYGCADLKSVATWFPRPAREYLAKYSAKIVCYCIQPGDYLLRMDSQGEVIFNKLSATVVETLPITTDIENHHA